ncbi:MAG: microviridin/marinostatin family tricyclic proteinase inhibitor [Fischerella sp. CENA71]|nr:microviridin/marinostatin family tricyclic proteinase inhibitor [Fischerella sp. CENA71]
MTIDSLNSTRHLQHVDLVLTNFPKGKIAMYTNTVKVSDIQVLPFFARFLQEQSASDEKPDTPPSTPPTPPTPPFTFKFPSDLEDL